MGICTETIMAANRYLENQIHLNSDAFRQTLADDVVLTHCRLEGAFQKNEMTWSGKEDVFRISKERFFDVTTNFTVHKWAVSCSYLIAQCDFSVEEDKDDPQGLQGHYKMEGRVKIVFVREPSTGDLKIKEIWEAASALKLS